MTPTPPPPIPVELAADALQHADDWGVLLFIVAALLTGLGGLLWVRRKEQEEAKGDRE